MDRTSPDSEAAPQRGNANQPFGAGVDVPSGRSAGGSSDAAETKRDRRRPRRRGGSRRRGRSRGEGGEGPGQGGGSQGAGGGEGSGSGAATAPEAREAGAPGSDGQAAAAPREGDAQRPQRGFKKNRRSKRGKGGRGGGGQGGAGAAVQERGAPGGGPGGGPTQGEIEGMIALEKANHAHLRLRENGYLPGKRDVHVSPRLVQRHQLRDGSIVRGPFGRGQGRHKLELLDVDLVDGMSPNDARAVPRFKDLTSIDPDFHYEVGDPSGDTSMRVLDIICPVGRGPRGLIVAPPRSGKTVLMQKFAQVIEQAYPEVHLIVLLVDERPEEATEWRRSVKGDVFVSTNDEMPKTHVELAEAVWLRAKRLVELGQDVVLLLDSITRLARAYNHVRGSSGKTMSGGLDSHAMERPRQFFGSARNTETAGSLTILGTTLIETGSRMDQLIFEEFKGTGNMELVLSRKLADRRIFPAIDVERSGTRKEEKLLGKKRLPLVTTLRRVLSRMHFAEAMELLITRLDDVEKTDDFLKRFEIDPDA